MALVPYWVDLRLQNPFTILKPKEKKTVKRIRPPIKGMPTFRLNEGARAKRINPTSSNPVPTKPQIGRYLLIDSPPPL
jgi:hypothetical protein